jgi:hypothetical protein
VNAEQTSSIFYIDSGTVTFSGLTITNGKNTEGGGIDNSGGTVTVSDCAVSGNTADFSGGAAGSTTTAR